MNLIPRRPMRCFHALSFCGLLILQLNLDLRPTAAQAAEEAGVTERTKAAVEDAKDKIKDSTAAVQEAAKDAKETVQDAGRTVGKSFEDLWQRADANRLKNRKPDEIVAWVIMGILVGAVAGLMAPLGTAGLGKLGRLLLGLAGAFVGGMIVNVGRIDFGMGPVLIRYEELLFSMLGAIALILVARMIGLLGEKPRKS
jgi:uncharacterized membrane protein YeaQ/YmgE (transglycosylase-associated protein family)